MQLCRLRSLIRPFVPSGLRSRLAIWWARRDPGFKSHCELAFWAERLQDKRPENEPGYYKKFMMDMGGITEQRFFDDLICLDIGCGPRGSLNWMSNARARIGLDSLAEEYMQFGIAAHPMSYLWCSSEDIPLPSRYVDVVFAMNALDHVDNLKRTCADIRRVLKPGGWFIGSLNLNEPRSITEPWTLTEEFLAKHLFDGWRKEFYEIRPKIQPDLYKYFYMECPPELMNRPGPKALWCRMRVPD